METGPKKISPNQPDTILEICKQTVDPKGFSESQTSLDENVKKYSLCRSRINSDRNEFYELVKKTGYFVEASPLEQQYLNSVYSTKDAHDDKFCFCSCKFLWTDVQLFHKRIGLIKDDPELPVELCFNFINISPRMSEPKKCKIVCFYYNLGNYGDWNMISDYISEFNIPKTDALNFSYCVKWLREED
jgi:hypothetical protein